MGQYARCPRDDALFATKGRRERVADRSGPGPPPLALLRNADGGDRDDGEHYRKHDGRPEDSPLEAAAHAKRAIRLPEQLRAGASDLKKHGDGYQDRDEDLHPAD